MTDPKSTYSHSNIDGRTFYHGTKADLRIGARFKAAIPPIIRNGNRHGSTSARPCARLLGERNWQGTARAGSYVVEPTGLFMDDPM